MGEILDSGERREFESGAVRDIADDKGRMDLVPLDIIADFLAQVSQGEFLPLNDINFSECYMFDRINLFIRSGNIKYIYWVLYLFIKDRYDEEIETAILDVSIHYQQGAKKYKERNWEKGIDAHCYVDSALRHGVKYFRGDNDEPHDRAFMWNLLGLLWTLKHKPELNDLPYNKKEEVKEEKNVEVKIAEANVPNKNCNIIPEEALKDAIANLDKSAIYKYFPKATHPMITIKATMDKYVIEKIIYNDISNFDILKVLSFSEENTGEEPKLAYKVYGVAFGSCHDVEFSVNPEEYDADFLIFICKLQQYNTGNPNEYYDTLHYRFFIASSEDDKSIFEINVTRIEVDVSTRMDIATEVPMTTTNSNDDIVELHLDKTIDNSNQACINESKEEPKEDINEVINNAIYKILIDYTKIIHHTSNSNICIGFNKPFADYYSLSDYKFGYSAEFSDNDFKVIAKCKVVTSFENSNSLTNEILFVFRDNDERTNFSAFCSYIKNISAITTKITIGCYGDIEKYYIESEEKKFKADYTELELYENCYPNEKRYQLSDDYGIVLTYTKKDMKDYFVVFTSMLQIFIDINSTHEGTVIGIENFTKYHHILKYVIGNEKMFIKNGYRFIIDCEIAYKGHYYLNRVRFLFNEVNSQFEELCKYFVDHEQGLSIKITYGYI